MKKCRFPKQWLEWRKKSSLANIMTLCMLSEWDFRWSAYVIKILLAMSARITVLLYGFAKHFRKILKQSLLPPMRFHDLHHTFVSILIGEGIPTADVQKLARHASYQTTIDIYRHLLPDELEKGLNHLDLLLESIEKTWKKGQGMKAI